MHDTAMDFGRRFFNTYLENAQGLTIVDIGAMDVNGSLKSTVPPNNKYVGIDVVEGKGVDIVLTDAYTLPFEDDSVDVCLSSSCFEHSEFFWLLFNEIIRILKPTGLFYLNTPSNGMFHRHPMDCWRFYPDSGIALQNWGRRNGHKVALLESFVGMQQKMMWNDFVAIFVKDEQFAINYPNKIQRTLKRYINGRTYGTSDLSNLTPLPQDLVAHRKLLRLVQSINKILKP